MTRKYNLLKNDSIQLEGNQLYRIEAVIDLRDGVTAGTLGGYIESEANLSHEDTAWVYPEARVYGHARVRGDAIIVGGSRVFDASTVSCRAHVVDSFVYSHASVGGDAKVSGWSTIRGHAAVHGSAVIENRSTVEGAARVADRAQINGAVIGDHARVLEFAYVANGLVGGRAILDGHARVLSPEAAIRSSRYLRTFDGIPGFTGPLSAYIRVDGHVEVVVELTGAPKSLVTGTLEEFKQLVSSQFGSVEGSIGWYYLGLTNLIAYWFSDAGQAALPADI